MTLAYTVALCTHNRADRLARTLADLSAIRAPQAPWELLVIDNASRDDTQDVLARRAGTDGRQARVAREARLGLSHARNRAIQEARGEYLIFMDDDETPDPGWLCACERLIREHSPDAFGGRIEVLFEDRRPAWITGELMGFLGELNRADAIIPLTERGTFFHGGNFGFRKAVCDTVGTFDTLLGRKGTDNTGGEEVDFYRRLLDAGCKVWWTPEAVIYHRIQAAKLRRMYFLELHYRQGCVEGSRSRRESSRLPPKHLYGQLARALRRALYRRLRLGSDHSLRLEMNVAYFAGYIRGWSR